LTSTFSIPFFSPHSFLKTMASSTMLATTKEFDLINRLSLYELTCLLEKAKITINSKAKKDSLVNLVCRNRSSLDLGMTKVSLVGSRPTCGDAGGKKINGKPCGQKILMESGLCNHHHKHPVTTSVTSVSSIDKKSSSIVRKDVVNQHTKEEKEEEEEVKESKEEKKQVFDKCQGRGCYWPVCDDAKNIGISMCRSHLQGLIDLSFTSGGKQGGTPPLNSPSSSSGGIKSTSSSSSTLNPQLSSSCSSSSSTTNPRLFLSPLLLPSP
jgi:hypothetical protein